MFLFYEGLEFRVQGLGFQGADNSRLLGLSRVWPLFS